MNAIAPEGSPGTGRPSSRKSVETTAQLRDGHRVRWSYRVAAQLVGAPGRICMNVRRRILSATCAALAATFVAGRPRGRVHAVDRDPQRGRDRQAREHRLRGHGRRARDHRRHRHRSEHAAADLLPDATARPVSPRRPAQRTAPNSKFDGDTFVESPAPFSLTSTIVFEQAGNYRFCAYLEIGLTNDTQPPAAFAEAVLRIGAPADPVHGAQGPRPDARVGDEEAQDGRLHPRQGLQAEAGLQEGEAHRALAERRADRRARAQLQGEPRPEGQAEEEVGRRPLGRRSAGGGTRTPDTRIMIPLL